MFPNIESSPCGIVAGIVSEIESSNAFNEYVENRDSDMTVSTTDLIIDSTNVWSIKFDVYYRQEYLKPPIVNRSIAGLQLYCFGEVGKQPPDLRKRGKLVIKRYE